MPLIAPSAFRGSNEIIRERTLADALRNLPGPLGSVLSGMLRDPGFDSLVNPIGLTRIINPAAKTLKEALRMSGDELAIAAKNARQSEMAHLTEVFGSEKAATRFKRLESRSGSILGSPRTGEAADLKLQEMINSLSPEKRRLLDTGGPPIGPEDLSAIRRGIQEIENVEDPEELAQTLAFDVISIGNARDINSMNFNQQLSLARLSRAKGLLAEKGFNTEGLSQKIIDIVSEKIGDPNDALFLLQRFARKGKSLGLLE